MPEARILVVDDEPDIRELVREILEDEGYAVDVAQDGESARAAFARRSPDLVLLDIWMPDIDGITLLKEWSDSGALNAPVVMISGHGTLETAVEATRLGAHDFIQKPLSLAKLLATVRQALTSQPAATATPVSTLPSVVAPIGKSPPMQLLRQRAEQAARHATPLLISGEAGSGKAALAAWIHRRSGRSGDFVSVDAEGLKAQPLDTFFNAARDGTLYIPEIQDLDDASQLRLAQVLESGQYSSGEAPPTALECRLVAGVSGDPTEHVDHGQLLDRLYLQINVLALHMPPLRERAEDVPELVQHYTDALANAERLDYRPFSIPALNRLRNHDWPGNERELCNLVQRLLSLGGEGEVSVREVDDALLRPAGADGALSPLIGAFDLPLREAREAFEREYLVYQLRKAGGSVGKLSEAVGMERTHLYRKLRSLGIDPKTVTRQGSGS